MPDKLKKLFGWLDFGGTIAGAGANVLSTILTNRKNEQLVKMQNAFQKQENELAYQRAKPQNQVSQMMQAGMSKAGALNAINGGATYQPAPISSATAQAPQIDLSSAFDGLLQIGENAKQRKLQEDLQEQQIKAATSAQQAQFEENEKQRKHDLEMQAREHTNTNRNADNRLNFDKEVHDYFKEDKRKEIRASIENLLKDRDLKVFEYERLKDLRNIMKESAMESLNLIKEQIKTAQSTRNLEYKKYLLDKIEAEFNYKFGAPISYLRESIDYWSNEDNGGFTAGRKLGWKSDDNKYLWTKEQSFREYLEQIETILDEIDNLKVE